MPFGIRIGDYPKEFNEKIHGPYDPARYYGKPDTAFGDVKLNDLGTWFLRRNKTPRAFAGLCSRAYWRWQHKYSLPKYSGLSFLVQYVVVVGALFYVMNITKYRAHKNAKYHW